MPEISRFYGIAVTAAEYIEDYKLCLTFNNGAVRVVDFVPLMQKGICKKLQDKDYFRSFKLDPFTVDWNNEIGFAPEYLFEIVTYPENEETTPLMAAEEQAKYGKKQD
ncbi:MAG: DUF2442 domain-containing protein [Bacteroidales bacterium]|nr:DUF2442 domain-containing protein [Bacteroidales bacterium]MBQ3843566.1 DUF2442 domain-containing protein [Bacteroidales bacterium]